MLNVNISSFVSLKQTSAQSTLEFKFPPQKVLQWFEIAGRHSLAAPIPCPFYQTMREENVDRCLESSFDYMSMNLISLDLKQSQKVQNHAFLCHERA